MSVARTTFSSGSRITAIRCLERCVEGGLPVDKVLRSRSLQRVSPDDHRLITEIVYGVLRNLSLLDFLIGSVSHRPLEDVEPAVRWILRVGVYQLKFLRIPAYAAVDESVRVCRQLGSFPAAGFVNALLRACQRCSAPLPTGDSAEDLATVYSHPGWLVRRYLARWGISRTRQILASNNERPELVVWVNPFKISMARFCESLHNANVTFHLLAEEKQRVRIDSAAFRESPLYEQGFCFSMDAASQEVAWIVDTVKANRVGDFCAAPGGKSFILRSRLPTSAQLVACDRSRSRLEAMRTRAERYGIGGLDSVVQADILSSVPFPRVFDRVLLDVPCSGLGTIRSNPDIRWKVTEERLFTYHQRQVAMIANAFSVLRPGGELVYSTCSTEPEENEDVVGALLCSLSSAELIGDYFRSTPPDYGGSGFFAARIRRN